LSSFYMFLPSRRPHDLIRLCYLGPPNPVYLWHLKIDLGLVCQGAGALNPLQVRSLLYCLKMVRAALYQISPLISPCLRGWVHATGTGEAIRLMAQDDIFIIFRLCLQCVYIAYLMYSALIDLMDDSLTIFQLQKTAQLINANLSKARCVTSIIFG